MTKKEVTIYECDDCGVIFNEESSFIKSCAVCEKDICEDCQDIHSKTECGF